MGDAASAVEVHTVEGVVLRVRQMTVRDTPMTQAVVKTDNDLVTCMWKTGGVQYAVPVVENSRYAFTGRLREVDTRRIMIEPSYQVVTADMAMAASQAKAKSGSKSAPAFMQRLKKLSKKQLIIGAVVAVALLAVVLPFALGSSDDSKKASTTTTSANAAPIPIDKLPQAYDASGKPIAATPDDCEVVTVAYSVIEKNDPQLPMGQVVVKPAGVNGQDKLCYVHGRGQFPVTTHLKKVVNEVKTTGTKR